MSINVSEVIWTIICFFALLFVLKKFLFDPLIKFMDQRQAGIDAGLEKGREAQRKKEENAAALCEGMDVVIDAVDDLSAKEALAVKNNELRDQRTEATGLIKEMEENEADYKDVLAEIEAEEEKTQKEIVRLSKELAAQQGNTTVTYGGYIWPVTTSKRVTSPFGKRNTGIKGASTNHRGIDIGGVYYSSTVYALSLIHI